MYRLAAIGLVLTGALALTTPAFAQADLDRSTPPPKPEAKKDEKKPDSEPPWRRFRGGGGGGGGPMGGANPTEGILEFLNAELDLDTEQETKIKKILKNIYELGRDEYDYAGVVRAIIEENTCLT